MSSIILRISRSIILIHHLFLMYRVHHLDFSKTTNRKVLDLKLFENRFLTGWNLGLQIIYLTFAIVNDIIQNESFENLTEKMKMKLRRFQEYFFIVMVFPCTMNVFTLFWSLWNIDRELVFPSVADQLITSIMNHGMHTVIITTLFTEIAFFEMENKFSHSSPLKILSSFTFTYYCVLFGTYLEHGRWIYPVFGELTWLQRFVFVTLVYLMGLFFYFTGRKIIEYRWKYKHSVTKKIEPNNNFNTNYVKKLE